MVNTYLFYANFETEPLHLRSDSLYGEPEASTYDLVDDRTAASEEDGKDANLMDLS